MSFSSFFFWLLINLKNSKRLRKCFAGRSMFHACQKQITITFLDVETQLSPQLLCWAVSPKYQSAPLFLRKHFQKKLQSWFSVLPNPDESKMLKLFFQLQSIFRTTCLTFCINWQLFTPTEQLNRIIMAHETLRVKKLLLILICTDLQVHVSS